MVHCISICIHIDAIFSITWSWQNGKMASTTPSNMSFICFKQPSPTADTAINAACLHRQSSAAIS